MQSCCFHWHCSTCKQYLHSACKAAQAGCLHANKLPPHAESMRPHVELVLCTYRRCLHMRKLNGHRAVAKLHFLASIMYKCQTEVNMIMFPLKPKWMTTCRLMKLEDMIELPYSGKLSGEKTFTNFTIFQPSVKVFSTKF